MIFLPIDTSSKLAKIILVTPKCKNILVLLNFDFLHNAIHINIVFYFIAPFKVFTFKCL